MEAADEAGAARVALGQLEGALNGLGTRVGEVHAVEVLRQGVVQGLGQAGRRGLY